MHFPFERIFESKTEQTEQKCTFIAMYILDYQQKQHVYPLLHRNGTNTGVTVSAHCSQERPAFRKSYEGKTGLTLIAVSSLFEKAEGAGMEIISFLSTR